MVSLCDASVRECTASEPLVATGVVGNTETTIHKTLRVEKILKCISE